MPLINPMLPLHEFQDAVHDAFITHRLTVPLLETMTRDLMAGMARLWGVAIIDADGRPLAKAMDARFPFPQTIFENPLLYEMFAASEALYNITRPGDFQNVTLRLRIPGDRYMDQFYMALVAIPGTPYAVFLVLDR